MTLAWVVAIPFLIIQLFKKKYRSSIPARFFCIKNPPLPQDGVWIHVCSYGEANAAQILFNKIKSEDLRITATTQTGFKQISEVSQNSRYLPFEPLLLWWLKPQKVLVVFEAELWYLLFLLSKKRGAKTLLVNARISDKSYAKYKRHAWLYKRVFANIDEVYAQSETDAARLKELGADNIKVMGNIKFANIKKATKKYEKNTDVFVCAASTHENEESLILEGFRELKLKKPNAKIAIVPRHPERFDKVDRMMRSFARLHDWSYHRFSSNKNFESDLVLVDALGELVNVYAISDIVVLGGSFEPIGGHNAAEAAQFGCKIISGEHYFNQKEIFEGIEGIKIVSKADLAEAMMYPNLLDSTVIKKKASTASIMRSINSVL
ncbi:MAG: lipid IV(A) 3-deoxy-D-manno-octulosonic acid transferase [Campylobacterales bacterium]|nr:lipid IV(A) 3-deoxy-D-manno-octulosonic acid transferase [Campylobacterales bacterium]